MFHLQKYQWRFIQTKHSTAREEKEKKVEVPTVHIKVDAPKEEPCDSYVDSKFSDQLVDFLTNDKKPQRRIIKFSSNKVNGVLPSNNDIIAPYSDVILPHNDVIKAETGLVDETATVSEDDTTGTKYIRSYWCPLCTFSYAKRSDVIKHLDSHDESTVQSAFTAGKCNICSMVAGSRPTHHLKQAWHVKSTFKCSECGYHWWTKDDTCGHDCDFSISETVGNNFKVAFTGRSFSFACVECGVAYRHFNKFVTHYKEQHSLKSSLDIICHVCGANLKTMGAYGQHMKFAHTTSSKPKSRPETGSVVQEGCGFKENPERESDQVRSRVDSKNVQRRFSCNICSRKFPNTYVLKRHIIGMHEVPPECDKCGKNFDTNVDYRNHYNQYHNKRVRRQQSMCSICGEWFKHRVSMQRHELSMHSSDKKPKKVGAFQCNSCGRYLVNKYALKFHQQKHCAKRKALLNGTDGQSALDKLTTKRSEVA